MALTAVLLAVFATMVTAQDDPFHGYTFPCSTAMECVDRSLCDFAGVISNEVIALEPALEARRMPLLPCKMKDKVTRGVCCRDPYYVDPWPNGHGGTVAPGCPARNRTSKTEDIVADFAEYPWQGAVLDTKKNHTCSCSYSAGDTCFTTIECVAGKTPDQLLVGVGKYLLSDNQTPDPAKIVKVKKIYQDPRYDPQNTLAFNVAVLKLAEKVTNDYHIQQICLDREQQIPTEKYTEKCVITGWGKTKKHDKNGWVYVDLLSSEECKAKDPKFDPKTSSCAKTHPNEDACKFDEGSGFQCPFEHGKDRKIYYKDLYYLKGVLSNVENCGKTEGQVVFFSKIDTSMWLSEAINAKF